ncbi:MAG: hypothetical protein HQK51_09405 [Oligoflexia bacterium]|nr:hypothetical protein [Oligoflexia bacterium]
MNDNLLKQYLFSKKICCNSNLAIAQLVNDPNLIRQIQKLNGKSLTTIIEKIGLEDCGEILALVNNQQLNQIADELLWNNNNPGEEEYFDDQKFALLLEVLLEAGEKETVKKITSMDQDLLVLGLSQSVLVVELEELAIRISNKKYFGHKDDLLEKTIESALSLELEKYLIVAKNEKTWESVINLLLILDKNDHNFLKIIFNRLSYLSSEYINENGGLYQVLNSEQILYSDVVSDREDRRESEGYISPQTAFAFLQSTRWSEYDLLSKESQDPITKKYFDNFIFSEEELSIAISKNNAFVLNLLNNNVSETKDDDNDQANISLDYKLIIESKKEWDKCFSLQLRKELNYLANILIAGCPFQGDRFRPLNAIDAVLGTCNLAAEIENFSNLEEALKNKSLIKLFKIGYNFLFWQVTIKAATELNQHLSNLINDGVLEIDLWVERQLINNQRILNRVIKKFLKKEINDCTMLFKHDFDFLQIIFDQTTIQTIKDLVTEFPTINSIFIKNKQQLILVDSFIEEIKKYH